MSLGVQWILIFPTSFPQDNYQQVSFCLLVLSVRILVMSRLGISAFYQPSHLHWGDTDYHRSEPEGHYSLKNLWWFLSRWWLWASGQMEGQRHPGSGDCSQQNLYLAIISSHHGLGKWFLLPKWILGCQACKTDLCFTFSPLPSFSGGHRKCQEQLCLCICILSSLSQLLVCLPGIPLGLGNPSILLPPVSWDGLSMFFLRMEV